MRILPASSSGCHNRSAMSATLPEDFEHVLLVRDRDASAVAIVAVHDTRLGPAHGGIRRWAYRDVDEALADVVALARAMTYKCALAGVPAGGGKAVILDHPELDRRRAYRLVGRAVAQLDGRFFTGPDVGTSAEDLDEVAAETRYVAVAGGDGPGDLAQATADGVLAAMVALAERLESRPDALHVVLQGLGAVGMALGRRLHELGARLSVHDVVAARCERAAQQFGAAVLTAEQVFRTPCDVFAPCALGGVLTASVAASLPARGVCGAANNVFADPAVAEAMHRRGVVVVPDFLANAGALIVGATFNLTGRRAAPGAALRIGETAAEVLSRSRDDDASPLRVALEVARERLSRGAGGA